MGDAAAARRLLLSVLLGVVIEAATPVIATQVGMVAYTWCPLGGGIIAVGGLVIFLIETGAVHCTVTHA